MSNLFVIAGPNGAGKSTSAPELLTGVRSVAEFVNADIIQKERAISEIEAGRILASERGHGRSARRVAGGKRRASHSGRRHQAKV
ncbi:MAG TPA: hypothetical protein VGX52_16320 [Burkholderiales bacterium]|nr:hypothetical protein [Burkholderiales bacterium]